MDTFSAPQRPHIPFSGPERLQLDAWLDFYRATVLIKCDGLTETQLKDRPVSTSTMSLLGLVRHLTFVEQVWFEDCFAGRDVVAYYKTESDRELDFTDLDSDDVEEVFARYDRARALSRELALGHELDEMCARPRRGGDVDLRWIYIHLIWEYARHCGHADLIRELIDGTTGY
ncbi:MAG: DinB family protein [Acidimicrobiales bacterium]